MLLGLGHLLFGCRQGNHVILVRGKLGRRLAQPLLQFPEPLLDHLDLLLQPRALLVLLLCGTLPLKNLLHLLIGRGDPLYELRGFLPSFRAQLVFGRDLHPQRVSVFGGRTQGIFNPVVVGDDLADPRQIPFRQACRLQFFREPAIKLSHRGFFRLQGLLQFWQFRLGGEPLAVNLPGFRRCLQGTADFLCLLFDGLDAMSDGLLRPGLSAQGAGVLHLSCVLLEVNQVLKLILAGLTRLQNILR
ncbi:MAG: hypothetical protein L0Z50_13460, partial [Verrucomicrobiales bacterium]|nr:hypothetical protein [Verrucomicrobiales bacterium]